MKFRFLLMSLVCALIVAAPVHASGGGGGGGGHGAKKEKAAKAPKKQRPITSLASWVSVDPFSVTVVQEDRISGKLLVSFGMDVPDEELRLKAELIMPRLQDAWLTQLSHYAGTTVRANRAANISDVSTLLQSTADLVLGKPGSKVLIGSVIVQMK